jgi:hypothetical protein
MIPGFIKDEMKNYFNKTGSEILLYFQTSTEYTKRNIMMMIMARNDFNERSINDFSNESINKINEDSIKKMLRGGFDDKKKNSIDCH